MANWCHFGLASLGAVSLVSLMAACSGSAPNDHAGSGPIDGEIPGSGAGAAGGSDEGCRAGVGTGGTSSGAGSSDGPVLTPGTGSGGATGASTGDVGGTGGVGGTPPVQPGTLTAGAWDDNRNFERFLGYRAELHEAQTPGVLGFPVDEHQASYEASPGWLAPHQQLDVALVIDTTGSMGDEITYLKTELIAISGEIARLHPNAEQRWSLIVYRDTEDEYLVRWFGFQDGVEGIQQHLAQQFANGGGDYEEAPDAAFTKLNELSRRGDASVARLAFWVADAPHHPQNAVAFTTALRRTRDLGVRVYPVASSGVDELTELTMRSAAQITGGRYLFLTDDSGVGGDHKEPSIPCYFVTKLDDAMVRMVDIEMSGVYHEPSPDEIVRAGGDPQDGACVLESGTEVVVY
jgi:hypothetical protein